MLFFTKMDIKSIKTATSTDNIVFITDKNTDWNSLPLTPQEVAFAKDQIARTDKDKHKLTTVNHYDRVISVVYLNEEKIKKDYNWNEQARQLGAEAAKDLNELKVQNAVLVNKSGFEQAAIYCAEGISLANYQFLKYKKDADKELHALKTIAIDEPSATAKEVEQLNNLISAVYIARNLVNEPLSHLNALQISKEFEKMGKEAGFKVTVWDKAKIEKNKMGGLLSVNKGSQDPPTFTIMEYKPKKALNQQPIVLVGKGVVYDTGGLSLKPTTNSMDFMKCDMGGAAVVATALYAAAKNQLPLHIIALVPATDNRPGENAYVPGDVINMHSGATVEMLNSDAEGRMILADALSYAQQYNPQLVVDVATLTGAATMVAGAEAAIVMGNTNTQTMHQIGLETHERVIELPLWDEYKEHIKSDIADIKNTGKERQAGSIIGGIFLQHFVNYPWLHVDIAAVAFKHDVTGYLVKGGTGFGTRLLYSFLKKLSEVK